MSDTRIGVAQSAGSHKIYDNFPIVQKTCISSCTAAYVMSAGTRQDSKFYILRTDTTTELVN